MLEVPDLPFSEDILLSPIAGNATAGLMTAMPPSGRASLPLPTDLRGDYVQKQSDWTFQRAISESTDTDASRPWPPPQRRRPEENHLLR